MIYKDQVLSVALISVFCSAVLLLCADRAAASFVESDNGYLKLARHTEYAMPVEQDCHEVVALADSGKPDAAEQKAAGAAEQSNEPDIAFVMNKLLLAYGGKENLSRVGTNCILHGKQKVISPDGGVANEINIQQINKGTKLRIDLFVPGQTGLESTTIFDGQLGWKSAGKLIAYLPPNAVKVLKEDAYRQPSALARWGEPAYGFRLIGRTSYKQIPVYTIEESHAGHSPTLFFVDQSNFLVVGSSYSTDGAGENNSTSINTDYAEYRPIDGTMVPFKQIQSVNGKESLNLIVDSVELTKTVADNLFERPSKSNSVRLSNVISIPFEYTQGELIVKVQLNSGDPLDFLLDTGASESMVDRRVAAESFLDKAGRMEISVVRGAVTTNASLIRKLELGNLAFDDVQALIYDLSGQSRQLGRPIAGIIGSNILNQFVVTIDYAKKIVSLVDAANYQAPQAPQAVHSVPFVEQSGPLVKASLNGQVEETFLIDTGAAFNHLPGVIARKFIQGQPQHLTEGIGLDGKPIQLGTVVVDSVVIDKLTVPKVSFTYPYTGESTGGPGGFFQTANLGILGNPFWQNFIVTIDYHAKRLILQAVASHKSGPDIEQLLTAGDTNLIISRDYRQAEAAYQKALALARAKSDEKNMARLLGRLGSLHRALAHDLNRPEQAKVSYQYFSQAQELARKIGDREIEGRILADWSLLYSDNGQSTEAGQTIEAGLLLAGNDPFVNVDNAVHLYRAGLYGEMQKYVDKSLFLSPSNWQALWYQVKLSEMFSDTAKQISTLKEILRFYPQSKLAKEKLATLIVPPAVPTVPPPVPAHR